MAGEYAGARGVVLVDTTGTAVGTSGSTAGGAGSRVELLASGTDTTINATSTLIFSTVTGSGASVIAELPAWCHSILYEYRVDSITGGSPANLQTQFGNVEPAGGAAISANWVSTTAIPPSASQANMLIAGRDVSGTAIGVTQPAGGGTGAIAFCPYLWRNFKITRLFSVAPTATLSAPWRLYCIGG